MDTGTYERVPDVDDFQLDRQVQRCHLCCGIWPDRYCVQYAGTEGCVLADLENAVSRVPSSDYLFVLIDANARTGVRMEEEDCKVIGAYDRDTRVSDSNGTSLLRFAGDNKLALVNTFFCVPKGCTSRTFTGTRPADRKRIATSSRDNHTASLSKMSLFTCSRMRIPTTTSSAPESASQGDSLVIENSEPPQGARVLTDEQSRLTPTDANG